MSKELDDLIEAKGWRKGQSVKLGYDDIDEYANQRVIKELKELYIGRMQSDDFFGMVISASDVRERIHKLKQD